MVKDNQNTISEVIMTIEIIYFDINNTLYLHIIQFIQIIVYNVMEMTLKQMMLSIAHDHQNILKTILN